jgi:hypothetical protein
MSEIAYCGLKCHECPLYIATMNQDDEMKRKLAVDYSTDSCKFTFEDMNCEGCHSPSVNDSKMCGDCEVRKCAAKKSIATCAECTAYPCSIIEKYVPAGSDNRILLDHIWVSGK